MNSRFTFVGSISNVYAEIVFNFEDFDWIIGTIDNQVLASWLKAKAVSQPIWSGQHGFNSCHPQHEACFVLSTKQYACLY